MVYSGHRTGDFEGEKEKTEQSTEEKQGTQLKMGKDLNKHFSKEDTMANR